MSTQLHLINGDRAGRRDGQADEATDVDIDADVDTGGRPRPWRLDPKTRRIGRDGVAAARLALSRARAPEPAKPLRRAG
jgi:hypothetical protein